MMHTLARFCIKIHLYAILHIIRDTFLTAFLTMMACLFGTSIICGGINMLHYPHLMKGPITAPLGAFGIIFDIILMLVAVVGAIIGVCTFWGKLKKTIAEEQSN